MYASTFQLQMCNMCRQSDLESAFYVAAFLLNGQMLPWYQDIRAGSAAGTIEQIIGYRLRNLTDLNHRVLESLPCKL